MLLRGRSQALLRGHRNALQSVESPSESPRSQIEELWRGRASNGGQSRTAVVLFSATFPLSLVSPTVGACNKTRSTSDV